MFVVPTLTAVTKPDIAFMVATAVFELLQLPPEVPLLVYVAVAPIHNGDAPLTVPALTLGSTVKVLEELRGLPLQAITV